MIERNLAVEVDALKIMYADLYKKLQEEQNNNAKVLLEILETIKGYLAGFNKSEITGGSMQC